MLHAGWEICKYACFLKDFGNTSWLLGWNIYFHMRLLSVRQLSMRASAIFLAFVEIQFARPAISSGSLWQRTTSDGEEKGTPTQWFSAITFSQLCIPMTSFVPLRYRRNGREGVPRSSTCSRRLIGHLVEDHVDSSWREEWSQIQCVSTLWESNMALESHLNSDTHL